MPPITRSFGVTFSAADRNPAAEQAIRDEIVEKVLIMQAKAAAKQKRALGRGTHAKGVTVRGRFEVLDVRAGRDSALAARLAKGLFAEPGVYPATIRFANSDSGVQSDFKPDVRSLSFSVDLTPRGGTTDDANGGRQDFSMQSARTLPLNDAPAFLAIMKLLTAENPVRELRSLSWRDKLRIFRALALLQAQTSKPLKPYQQLRYWSNVPFRHGPVDVVKHSATPAPDNLAAPLNKSNTNGLKDELTRHVNEDGRMSSFDFGLQFLDTGKMTYWGRASRRRFLDRKRECRVGRIGGAFPQRGAPNAFAQVAVGGDCGGGHLFRCNRPFNGGQYAAGSINRARWAGEAASRKLAWGIDPCAAFIIRFAKGFRVNPPPALRIFRSTATSHSPVCYLRVRCLGFHRPSRGVVDKSHARKERSDSGEFHRGRPGRGRGTSGIVTAIARGGSGELPH